MHVLDKQAVVWWEIGDERCWRLPHPVCVLFGRNVAYIAKTEYIAKTVCTTAGRRQSTALLINLGDDSCFSPSKPVHVI